MTGSNTFPQIISRYSHFDIFQQIIIGRVVIHGPRQRSLESAQVGTTFVGINIIGKRKKIFSS